MASNEEMNETLKLKNFEKKFENNDNTLCDLKLIYELKVKIFINIGT